MNVTDFITIFGIGIGLSMDAFAVAITQGVCLDVRTIKYPLVIGVTFGIFQAVMPLIGWFAGFRFRSIIEHIDHWIAFTLLSIIGIHMFVTGYSHYRKIRKDVAAPACRISSHGRLTHHVLLGMGIATSIDALAVGITFGMLRIDIWFAILIIGCTTAILSFIGVLVGKRAGVLLGDKMEMVGGIVLCVLGTHILIDHLIKGI